MIRTALTFGFSLMLLFAVMPVRAEDMSACTLQQGMCTQRCGGNNACVAQCLQAGIECLNRISNGGGGADSDTASQWGSSPPISPGIGSQGRAGSRSTPPSSDGDCPNPGGPKRWPQGGRCGSVVW
jgi:hypothetical protein